MRYRTKSEVIEYVQSSERVGEVIACLVDALETNFGSIGRIKAGVLQARLFDVIDEEREFARTEALESEAS